MNPTLLIAEHISFSRNGRKILDDLSLTLEAGQVTIVLGPNGAGKTTLLKILAGDLKPDSGQVFIDGRALKDWPLSEISKVRGVLPQESQLSFPFKAIEVVLLGRTPHHRGIDSPVDYRIAREALKLVDLADCAERDYTTLSGGEKQRVQTARVLAQIWEAQTGTVSLLMLDEPTGGLDLSHQFAALRIAGDFASRGTAVFASLHDLNLAANYADKIIILHRGMIAAIGTPKDVLQPEIIANVFQVNVKLLQVNDISTSYILTSP